MFREKVEDINNPLNAAIPAGFFLRFAAVLLDFFLFFTLVSVFYVPEQGESRIGFIVIFLTAITLYEIIFKNTPGKQLLNIKIVFERKAVRYHLIREVLKYLLGWLTVLSKPFGREKKYLHDRICFTHVRKLPSRFRPLKAVVLVILALNIFLTFGVGNVIWNWMKIYIDLKRVDTIPETVTLEQKTVSGEGPVLWNEGFRIRPPRNFNGMKMERSSLMSGYDITYNDQERGLGIFVLLANLFHPCMKCLPETGNGWRLVLPCSKSPTAVQDAVFNVSLKDRYFIWNPLDMIRTNMRLFDKDISTKGIGDDFIFRRLVRNGISIVWVFSEIKPDVESDVPLRFFKDILYLATPSTYGELIVLWKGKFRDEQLVWTLINTLELWEPGPGDLDREFQLARKHRSIPHAVNAFRLSNRKYETGEFLFQLLSEKGTTFEKRAFSLAILSLKDRRYKKLAYLTWEWRGKKHQDEIPTPAEIEAIIDRVMKRKK